MSTELGGDGLPIELLELQFLAGVDKQVTPIVAVSEC